ncbi:peptidase inhibitor family I36 protein [Streptomyces sp. NPDC026665]|uniref:peptidase inhibitor family I36 protein n=1 Tax=Streptomyces sp. NPDC026665 TaxID=3154798 RepID=UPI0033C69415
MVWRISADRTEKGHGLRLRHRVAAVLPAVAAVLAATLGLAPEAGAAASCPASSMCIWENAGYTGGRLVLKEYEDLGHCWEKTNNFGYLKFDNGHSVNDRISSVINNTSATRSLYRDQNFSGGSFGLSGHQWIPNLSSFTYYDKQVNFNDAVSSVC